jgi:hypothetical protein
MLVHQDDLDRLGLWPALLKGVPAAETDRGGADPAGVGRHEGGTARYLPGFSWFAGLALIRWRRGI